MSHRTAGWLAWSLWAVCVVLIGLALLLDFVTRTVPVPPGTRASLGFAILMAVLSLASPTVGALIASRLPTNPIGWIFCSVGLLYAAQALHDGLRRLRIVGESRVALGEYTRPGSRRGYGSPNL